MTVLAINWQTNQPVIEIINTETFDQSTGPSEFSIEETVKTQSDWKIDKLLDIGTEKTVEKPIHFPFSTDDDISNVFHKLRADFGIVAEPHLIPDELIRFFKEKPLIPFVHPIEKSEKPFEEAFDQWIKKKMTPDTTQQ